MGTERRVTQDFLDALVKRAGFPGAHTAEFAGSHPTGRTLTGARLPRQRS